VTAAQRQLNLALYKEKRRWILICEAAARAGRVRMGRIKAADKVEEQAAKALAQQNRRR